MPKRFRDLTIALWLMPAIAFAQTASFPGSIVTDQQLMVAVNGISTTLLAAQGSSDTVAVVKSSTGIVPNMLISVGTTSPEIEVVCAVAGNTLTIGRSGVCPSISGRGFDSTSAAAHAANSPVKGNDVAWLPNSVRAEVKAIETSLGTNLSNVIGSGPLLSSAAYVFSPQTCNSSAVCTAGGASGLSLIIGANVLTMTPVPLGVNGSDTLHNLYVSGGTGTAEGCLITGGAGTSGQTSGQIIVTCANTHSGAWTIQSASDGIAEVSKVVGVGGALYIPAGVHHLKSTVTFSGCQSVIGPGAGQVEILQDFVAGDAFYFANTGCSFYPSSSTIRGISFNSSVTITSGWALHVYGGDGDVSDIAYSNVLNAIQLDTFTRGTVSHIRGSHSGIGIQLGNTGASGPAISDWIESANGTNATGLYCYYCLFNLTNFDLQEVGSSSRGIVINGAVGAGESTISNGIIDSAQAAITTVGAGTVSGVQFSNLYLVNGAAPVGSIAISLGATHTYGFSFDNVRVVGYGGAGSCEIQIGGASADINFHNLRMGNAGAASTCGIGMIGTALTGLQISDSLIGVNFDGTDDANYTYSLFAAAGFDRLYATGGRFVGSTARIANLSTPTTAVIKNVSGVSDVTGTITGGATITFPVNDFGTYSSATGVTAVAGLWAGRTGWFQNTNATPGAVTAGATIGTSCTIAQNKMYSFFFDGTKIWLVGPGC